MPSSTLIADAKWGIFSCGKLQLYVLGQLFLENYNSRGRDYGKIKERISIIKIIMVLKILKKNNTIFNIKI